MNVKRRGEYVSKRKRTNKIFYSVIKLKSQKAIYYLNVCKHETMN